MSKERLNLDKRIGLSDGITLNKDSVKVKELGSNSDVSEQACVHDWEYVGTVNAEYCHKCTKWQDC